MLTKAIENYEKFEKDPWLPLYYLIIYVIAVIFSFFKPDVFNIWGVDFDIAGHFAAICSISFLLIFYIKIALIRSKAKTRLSILASNEKEVLKGFIKNDASSVIFLNHHKNTAILLISEHIIISCQEDTKRTNCIWLTIYPWILKYLNNNKHLLN